MSRESSVTRALTNWRKEVQDEAGQIRVKQLKEDSVVHLKTAKGVDLNLSVLITYTQEKEEKQ